MRKYLIIIIFFLQSCSSSFETESKPKIYCGFVEEDYFEYWFYNDTLVFYNLNRGNISQYCTLIRNDSIVFFQDEEKITSFKILEYNSDILVLKDINFINGYFIRFQVPYNIDAKRAREEFNSLYLEFGNESLKRMNFLYEYLADSTFIEKCKAIYF